jgi:hypothetical protein
LDFKIILQWKKTQKKFLKNNKIICYTKEKKACKINLWLEKFKAKRWLKYVWKFSDGRIINKKNPKSLDFKIGNYFVNLEILYKWKIIKKEKIDIFVKQEKKVKKKKQVKKSNKNFWKNKLKKEKIKQKKFFIQTVNAWYILEKNDNKKWFFSGIWYLFIGILLIYLVYIILKKEGFLEEEK